MEAINFTQAHDDGAATRDLDKAQVILVGVSRCGKTPTSLYLALQFGIRAANFPLTPDDFADRKLPASVAPFREQAVRAHDPAGAPARDPRGAAARQPATRQLDNCRYEVREAEHLMQQRGHPDARHDDEVDRGDRDDDPAPRETRTPHLLSGTPDDRRQPRARFVVRHATPVGPDGSLDDSTDGGPCARLLATGVEGVAPFGTTGEGPSFSVDERRSGLEALLRGGIAPRQIVVGTGCASLTDTLGAHAARARKRRRTLPGAAALFLQEPVRRRGVRALRNADRSRRRLAAARCTSITSRNSAASAYGPIRCDGLPTPTRAVVQARARDL